MKHITYIQFCKIKEALCEHADRQKNPYSYLFELINGYPVNHQRTHDEPKKLLNLSQIKKIWDNQEAHKTLIDLAIMKHYERHSVSTDASSSEVIYRDTLELKSRKILKKIKSL